MLLLGIDLGTSSVKVSVLDSNDQSVLASSQSPDREAPILSSRPGWAEQDPASWWSYLVEAFEKCVALGTFKPGDIGAIGIGYQMHGLVVTGKGQNVLRNAIIWSDSRAVSLGEMAAQALGEEYCRDHLLNSPGNFTASKLAWVKANEPLVYDQIDKMMLPGDYLAMKLTGEISTTVTGLSEGIFYDFKEASLSRPLLDYFKFPETIIPPVKDSFDVHGHISPEVAAHLGLKPGIPVAYKAGDQPNNALSLGVLDSGVVAATAGTSGVIYAVTESLLSDKASRINTFAHVNYQKEHPRLGVLLCINGTGSMNRWIRDLIGGDLSYAEINDQAARVPFGSMGVKVMPFGNGAERMLFNKHPGASITGLDLNQHSAANLYRATQEGIAAAFRYGLDIMRENALNVSMVRAGRSNMFLSDLFCQSFVDLTQTPLELFATDGSMGAALGAGIGAGVYSSAAEATAGLKQLGSFEPGRDTTHHYQEWKHLLSGFLP